MTTTDKKWIDALAKLAAERGGSNIVKTYSDNPRAPEPAVNAYKTLKAWLLLYTPSGGQH